MEDETEVSDVKGIKDMKEEEVLEKDGVGLTMGSEASQVRKQLLSTSSPEGIQVAAQITPTRLANLLIRKGPLPIRHITSQLALEVQGFEMLSLSKQRRLIMAAMEQRDPENNVVFEKIGWGQWAVRHIDSDYIVTEGTEGIEDGNKKQINVHQLRNQTGVKLGWSKKQGQQENSRRTSISNKHSNLHNLKVPNEHLNSDSNAIELDSESEYGLSGIEDGDEDNNEAVEEEDEESHEGDEDELFAFDDDEDTKRVGRSTRSPPIKFANRVPLRFNSPPAHSSSHRSSWSHTHNSFISKSSHPRSLLHRSRSRLDSLENLDNYIFSSSRNSNLSVNSPTQTNSGLPVASWHSASAPIHSTDFLNSFSKNISAAGRRKSSFNESHLRSTLLPFLQSPHPNNTSGDSYPLGASGNGKPYANISDTDEEDWAAIGAESLRSKSKSSLPPEKAASATKGSDDESHRRKDQNDESAAAHALVNLMSV